MARPLGVTKVWTYIRTGHSHAVGVSYARHDDSSVSELESMEILSSFNGTVGSGVNTTPTTVARVSFRATTLDKLPIVGQVPETIKSDSSTALDKVPGLFCFTGLGSRAMISSQLCAAHLCSIIAGSVSPIPKSMQAALSVERELHRALKNAGKKPSREI